MTLVYYYVPEDKDDPDCPNVFGVSQSKANIRLPHIYQQFPLKGSYLFRFKYNNEGSPVWLDLPHVSSKIPLFKDRIIMKATRVSWNQSKLHSQYKDKEKPKTVTPVKPDIDFFDEKQSNLPKQPEKKSSIEVKESKPAVTQNGHKDTTFNLLDDHNHNGSSHTPMRGEVNLMQGMEKHGDLI